jgi:hypothetical protein
MSRAHPAFFFLIALVLSGAWFFLQSDVRLDWSDEGFLWYGVRQTVRGEVPLRDFESYDPGRYYWSAALSPVFGDGVMGVRKSASLFQALALGLGLLVLRRSLITWSALLLAAFAALIWQFFAFRYFDACYPILTLFFASRLAAEPSRTNHIYAGVFTGFSFWFGLNHALYALAAFYALSLVYEKKRLLEHGATSRVSFLLASIAGALPLIGMALLIPGFWDAYLEWVWILFSAAGQGGTDIHAPIRWPWLVPWGDIMKVPDARVGFLQCLSWLFQGFAFLLMPGFYLFSAFKLFKASGEELRARSVWTAAFFVGVPYIHHSFARGDVIHLGEGMFPLIAALSGSHQMLWGFFILITLLGALPVNNLFFKAFVPADKMTPYRVQGETIWIFLRDARLAENYKSILTAFVRPDEKIFFAPIYTTLYCVLDRPSPTHKIYFFKPEPENRQKKTIEELEEAGVEWAIVGDVAIDGREELRFSNAYRLVWNYLAAHFEIMEVPGLPPEHYLLRRSLKASG